MVNTIKIHMEKRFQNATFNFCLSKVQIPPIGLIKLFFLRWWARFLENGILAKSSKKEINAGQFLRHFLMENPLNN